MGIDFKGLDNECGYETNEKGGKQGKCFYRFDLLPPSAMFKAAEVFKFGAEKYAIDNWKKIDSRTHLNHALIHAYAYLQDNTQDDHLGHFLARALMFVEMAIIEQQQPKEDSSINMQLVVDMLTGEDIQ